MTGSRLCLAAALLGCALATSAPRIASTQNSQPFLLRDPTVSGTQIAFSYGGDIWITNRDGGHLRPLTSGGHDIKPFFSPDGTQLAYTGDYDGVGGAVYVVPAAGGSPRQLTFHPGDLVVAGWTPDGQQVLFSSARLPFAPAADQNMRLFTVPANGGAVTAVPLLRASQGSYSPDGSRMAYVPNVQWQHAEDAWKRYRGGQTQPIWIVRLSDSRVEAKIPRDNSNDFNPIWVGGTVYFLSDREGPVTLFSYDVRSGRVTRLIENKGLDLKSAAAAAGTIVYEQFGSLHILDLKTGENRALEIRPSGDFPEVQPHFRKLAGNEIRSGAISPNGAMAALEVHGEILAVPALPGAIRNLTNTTDSVERDPAWSPDGKAIAYFSDASGEWALHVRTVGNVDEVRKYDPGPPPNFYYRPVWSLDSHKIAYTDARLNVWYIDLERGRPVHVDTDPYASIDGNWGPLGNVLEPSWSPDGRWLAYAKHLPNGLHALFAYSVEAARSFQLTRGDSDAAHPVFDRDSRYLYFTSSTNAGLTASWSDMSAYEHPVVYNVYRLPLQSKSQAGPTGTTQLQLALDPEEVVQRIVPVPIPGAYYVRLVAGKSGELYLLEGPAFGRNGNYVWPPVSVHRFDPTTQRTQQLLTDVNARSFALSLDGEQMLYARADQWFIAATHPATGGLQGPGSAAALDLSQLQVYVDPRAEWKHIYDQAWREQQEFFYDPALHGLDVESSKSRYAPYLDHLVTHEELNYLLREMLANITVSHMFILSSGEEGLAARRRNVGMLGADYVVEHDRYRFTHLYAPDVWNPESRAPLSGPDTGVRVGEYLLAVDGREVYATADVYSYFTGTAGKRTSIRVGPNVDGSAARELTVVPLDDEAALRHHAWISNNRRRVDEATGGRVAYVFLPNTYGAGYASFNRYYFSQVGKDAAIIDARYNHGGDFADYVVDHLRRPLLGYWRPRDGGDVSTPQQGIFGPKVMLINEMSGSGGDLLPWMFRKLGIGPLIGKRTWGGLVGSYIQTDDLLDGTVINVPDFRFYDTDGTWQVENRGVAPDFEVEDDPQAERAGRDPQLEKAIEVILQRLQSNPPPRPGKPHYQDYQRGPGS